MYKDQTSKTGGKIMRNPKECAVIRSKKTLIFENMLSPYNANGDDKTSPLQNDDH